MIVDHELDALKREFLDEARMKVAEMESELSRPHDAGSTERLAYIAHQLKGSGGSYGYQNISTTAAELEKTLESLPADASTDEGSLRRYLARLQNEIDERRKELPV